ncbi:hypothetical protein WKI45_04945, partial [Delftia tsuruhatensis]
SIMFSIILINLLWSDFGRRKTIVFSILTIIALLMPFSKIGLTLRISYKDRMALVECCEQRVMGNSDRKSLLCGSTVEDCQLCSDLRTGYEPKYYLFW